MEGECFIVCGRPSAGSRAPTPGIPVRLRRARGRAVPLWRIARGLVGAARVLHAKYAGKIAHDGDESDHAVIYFGEPFSGYVLIKRDHLVAVTSLEHERRKRAHPEFCRKMGLSKDKPGR